MLRRLIILLLIVGCEGKKDFPQINSLYEGNKLKEYLQGIWNVTHYIDKDTIKITDKFYWEWDIDSVRVVRSGKPEIDETFNIIFQDSLTAIITVINNNSSIMELRLKFNPISNNEQIMMEFINDRFLDELLLKRINSSLPE